MLGRFGEDREPHGTEHRAAHSNWSRDTVTTKTFKIISNSPLCLMLLDKPLAGK